MQTGTERSVLHVLPHPGGGGETYVDLLDGMPGYRFERAYLAASASTSPVRVARGAIGVLRRSREFDLLHVHGEVGSALCLPALAARPSVVTLHGLHLVRRQSDPRRMAAAFGLWAILRAADRTICVSQSEHDEVVRVVGAGAARRAVVVRNGVSPPVTASPEERSSVRGSLGIPLDETVAIWVGSLDERKDPMAAVRAAEAARVTLLVVGDGPLRAEVERAASERVRVLGPRADVGRLLGAADAFVLTSHREGLSFSLLEAMAHRLPAVVTPLPENVEAIGDAGVATRADVDALASVLRRLADSPTERSQLGEQAFRRVAELFSAARMRDRTRALYDELLVRRQRVSLRSATR